MKRLLTLLLFYAVLCSFAFTPKLFAQQQEEIPIDTTTTVEESDPNDFFTTPPQFPADENSTDYITDITKSVTVTFPGLDTSNMGNYEVCFRTDYCIGNWAVAALDNNKITRLLTTSGIKDDEMRKKELESASVFAGNAIKVCGDGKKELKTDCDNDDYFHAGNFYLITIYDKSDNYIAVARGGFYVSHATPDVNILPNTNLTPGQKFEVSIKQETKPGGKNRNNFQVVLEAPGYKEDLCGELKNNSLSLSFPKEKDDERLRQNGFTIPGTYLFKINEQNDEGGAFNNDNCQGGFSYMYITCTIGNDSNRNRCKKVIDPKGEDGKKLLNLLNLINGSAAGGVLLPCNSKEPFVKDPLDCDTIDTAIGPIQLTPVGFITRLFSIVLSIAGVGALFLIIYSGYRLMISRGNPEAIKGAKETLTATIIGLVFIVFAFVILSVIAGDILKIPGFG